MTTCDGCVFAEWKLDEDGRPHPDRSGRCGYLSAHPLHLRLPAAFYWLSDDPPTERRIERSPPYYKEHSCVFKKVA